MPQSLPCTAYFLCNPPILSAASPPCPKAAAGRADEFLANIGARFDLARLMRFVRYPAVGCLKRPAVLQNQRQ
ncbi:hypothetical protein WMC41_26200 (plasmid) [Shinella yambaruensis]|uniref:hypothetical protein n=1 Tax=Shinella yambaruensis TaxID=415996 RepID=UPI003D7B86E2